ncbi:MAG: D-alanyl-D-alanine carboxypeptidase family protein [Deltaproteobacteria bacterium]
MHSFLGDDLKKYFVLYVITCLCILNIICFTSYGDDYIENEPVEDSVFSATNLNNKINIPKIHSGSAIVMDRLSGRILYEKNGYTQRPMASTTKIMTAILALEKGKLSDIVTVSERAARVGGSNIHLKKNEKISLNDLLYGLMLSSGNDAAIAIAEHIGESVENFACMMTNKAHKIGANNSAFQTPHGLDKQGHYSTAYDLAIMANYALRNKKFAEIVSTKEAVISNGRKLVTTNEMLRGYEGANGVKTGFTGKAGRCLVTSASRNGWQIISVVLGSDSRQMRASDSTKMLNYAFENYKLVNLNNSMREIKIEVNKGKYKFIKIRGEGDEKFPLRKDEISNLKIIYNLPKKLNAPLKKGTPIGSIIYSSKGKTIKELNISLDNQIEKKSVINFYNDIIVFWVSESEKVFIDSLLKL